LAQAVLPNTMGVANFRARGLSKFLGGINDDALFGVTSRVSILSLCRDEIKAMMSEFI